ncbi:MAG: FAD:protein FMN transferase [Dehalococcoidales bacterium]
MKKKMNRRDFLRITAIGAGVIAAGGIGIKQLMDAAGPERISETRRMMGTFVTITVIGDDKAAGTAIVQDTFAEIGRLSSILSRHDSSSELARLNASGSLTGASSELVSVLERAQVYAMLSGGAFDVTMKPLQDLYQDSFANNRPPDTADISGALALVGYRNLIIKGRDLTLVKQGMGITLDGIGKGYIVDQAAGLLKARGMTQVLVEAGGDLSLRGMRQDGDPWKVGIVHPRALSGYYEVVESSNSCMATSGDYESAYTADYSYHHIIDPRTGYSPAELASATVTATDTTYADALSTAALVMGADEALALLEGLTGVEGLLIDKNLHSRATSGFIAAGGA